MAKKCFIFSFLCPVYGLGALAILWTAGKLVHHPFLVFLVGAVVATVVEYGVGAFYRQVFGFRIWNYSDMPLNINGHVCLLFTVFWGILSLILVYLVHPQIQRYTSYVPGKMCIILLSLFILDAIASTAVLMHYHEKQALNLTWILKNV